MTVAPPVIKSTIRTFSHHYRRKYGEAIGKIPIDTGVACPNRAKGGCIFCRPASFTPGYLKKEEDIALQIRRGKDQLLKGRFRKYFAYFQQETSTATAVDKLLPMLRLPLQDPDCVGLLISTRPDYLPDNLLEPLAALVAESGKECLLELGLQTVHESSLQLLNRNHGYPAFVDALQRIKSFGMFEVGAHLIFGIPGETEEDMLQTLRQVCDLGIDALKLHHLQVIRDTPLHAIYERDELRLFTLEEYIAFLLRALPMIPFRVVIHRLWATSHPDLLVAPKWNILAAQLSRELQRQMESLNVCQGTTNGTVTQTVTNSTKGE